MLVMQCFQVIYWGISHESVVFPLYTHGRLGEWVCQENASDKWDIPWYITSKHCITVSYHAIEYTVAIAMCFGMIGCDTIELHWSWEGLVEYQRIYNTFLASWLVVFSGISLYIKFSKLWCYRKSVFWKISHVKPLVHKFCFPLW